VEVELSDWLKEATACGDNRTTAEQLFSGYRTTVEVKLEQEKFSRLTGPEADINQLEKELVRMFRMGADVHNSAGSHVVNGYSSCFDQLTVGSMQQEQHVEEAISEPSLYAHSSFHSVDTCSPASSTENDINGGSFYHTLLYELYRIYRVGQKMGPQTPDHNSVSS